MCFTYRRKLDVTNPTHQHSLDWRISDLISDKLVNVFYRHLRPVNGLSYIDPKNLYQLIFNS